MKKRGEVLVGGGLGRGKGMEIWRAGGQQAARQAGSGEPRQGQARARTGCLTNGRASCRGMEDAPHLSWFLHPRGTSCSPGLERPSSNFLCFLAFNPSYQSSIDEGINKPQWFLWKKLTVERTRRVDSVSFLWQIYDVCRFLGRCASPRCWRVKQWADKKRTNKVWSALTGITKNWKYPPHFASPLLLKSALDDFIVKTKSWQ